jgi:hypothetical protein
MLSRIFNVIEFAFSQELLTIVWTCIGNCLPSIDEETMFLLLLGHRLLSFDSSIRCKGILCIE